MSGMRIAMFTDNFHPELGGIQDSVLASVRELGARGHRLLLFAPAPAARDYGRANLPVAEVDLGPNVTIRRLPAWPVPSPTQQSRLVVPAGRSLGELAAFRPDVLHSQTFFGVGLEALWAARQTRLPFIGTNHWSSGAFDAYALLGRAILRRTSQWLMTQYYRRCILVTAPSRFSVEAMRACGLSGPCEAVSNPIDTECFHPVDPSRRGALKAKLGLGPETIVYAGRFGREKRLDVLIRAFAALSMERPEAETRFCRPRQQGRRTCRAGRTTWRRRAYPVRRHARSCCAR